MTDINSKPQIALDTPGAKIWRFMDLSKFVSLLATRSLHFARPSSFHDPFEGWMPRSYIAALAEKNQTFIQQHEELKRQFAQFHPDADLATFNAAVNANLANYAAQSNRLIEEVVAKFGVNCWHRSEYESEAMWRLYAEDCLAIESTIAQLRDSNRTEKDVLIQNVRYMDFDRDPIEKGHEQQILVLKRKSFEHEKELRAIVFLDRGTQGAFLKYDLDMLVTAIHISPRASDIFRQAVSNIMAGAVPTLNRPLAVSTLYQKPDYNFDLKVPIPDSTPT